MDDQQRPVRASQQSNGVARRGILAGLAALAAGTLGRAATPAQATHNGSGTPGADSLALHVGQTNSATGSTVLNRGNLNVSDAALAVTNSHGEAVSGDSIDSYGVHGNSTNFVGVFGRSTNSVAISGYSVAPAASPSFPIAGVTAFAENNYGLIGSTSAAASLGMAGVFGRSYSNGNPGGGSFGVRGESTSGTGTAGQSNSGVGVHGSSNGNVGVLGVSNASVGVYANSISSTGLYATSGSGTGIVASTNGGNAIQGASNGNVGVLGTSNSSIGGFFSSGTATGLYATGPASGFAARFDGPVLVNGNFTAIGGSKSAAVPHPDGSYRRLYCVESPESWFEDFGRAQLVNGRVQVRLDRDFIALVHSDNYDVFLTPYGPTRGLYVSDRGPNNFEVREVDGTSSVAFSYRVLAKRRDIPGPRLEKVDLPSAPQRFAAPPTPPAIPPLPPLPDPSAAPRPGRDPFTGRQS